MAKKTKSEIRHEKFLALAEPLMDFMTENDYSCFFLVGKEGMYTRLINGRGKDLVGMFVGTMEDNKAAAELIIEVADIYENEERYTLKNRGGKKPLVN